jgi:hypothetical protein
MARLWAQGLSKFGSSVGPRCQLQGYIVAHSGQRQGPLRTHGCLKFGSLVVYGGLSVSPSCDRDEMRVRDRAGLWLG